MLSPLILLDRGSPGLASPFIGVTGCCERPFQRASGCVCEVHGDK